MNPHCDLPMSIQMAAEHPKLSAFEFSMYYNAWIRHQFVLPLNNIEVVPVEVRDSQGKKRIAYREQKVTPSRSTQ